MINYTAQIIHKANIPNIEVFVNKTPSDNKNLYKKGLYGLEKPMLEDEEQICFFFDDKNSKLKNVFAVVHNGILYFNVKSILSNRNKNDGAQDSDNPNSFTRVLLGGDNYQYAEINIGNVWEKGFAYGAVGGATGSSLANLANSYKGIVWDYANNEFNIFKNCKDYNDFIKDKSPNDIQTCVNKQTDNVKIRIAMLKIK